MKITDPWAMKLTIRANRTKKYEYKRIAEYIQSLVDKIAELERNKR